MVEKIDSRITEAINLTADEETCEEQGNYADPAYMQCLRGLRQEFTDMTEFGTVTFPTDIMPPALRYIKL